MQNYMSFQMSQAQMKIQLNMTNLMAFPDNTPQPQLQHPPQYPPQPQLQHPYQYPPQPHAPQPPRERTPTPPPPREQASQPRRSQSVVQNPAAPPSSPIGDPDEEWDILEDFWT